MIDHLSYSAIDTFLTCPLKFKFRYVDKKPEITSPAAALGKAFHKAMESNFRFRLVQHVDQPLPQVIAAFETEFKDAVDHPMYKKDEAPNEVTIDWRGESKARVRDSGIALVKRYYRDQVPFMEPAEVEAKYELPLQGKHIKYLVGYIDLILKSGIVIDYKTVMQPWKEDRVHVHMQPTFYSLLLGRPTSFDFHFIVKNSTREAGISVRRTERSQKDIDWLSSQLQNYVNIIENCLETGSFPASPGVHCSYCDYRRPCGYRT